MCVFCVVELPGMAWLRFLYAVEGVRVCEGSMSVCVIWRGSMCVCIYVGDTGGMCV